MLKSDNVIKNKTKQIFILETKYIMKAHMKLPFITRGECCGLKKTLLPEQYFQL